MSRKIIAIFGELVGSFLIETIESDGQNRELQWLVKVPRNEPIIKPTLELAREDEERFYRRPVNVDPSVLQARPVSAQARSLRNRSGAVSRRSYGKASRNLSNRIGKSNLPNPVVRPRLSLTIKNQKVGAHAQNACRIVW